MQAKRQAAPQRVMRQARGNLDPQLQGVTLWAERGPGAQIERHRQRRLGLFGKLFDDQPPSASGAAPVD